MRQIPLILSAAFAAYGLFPFKKGLNIDTSLPDQLIVIQKQCGCPCPNAAILEGHLKIPSDLNSKFQPQQLKQINLDMEDYSGLNHFEISLARLYVKGKVIGADTVLCEPTNCELTPRFRVEAWGLVDNVATVSTPY